METWGACFSSSSSLRHQALMRAVEADNLGVTVAFMNEIIILI
jgi:hypothetical protein